MLLQAWHRCRPWLIAVRSPSGTAVMAHNSTLGSRSMSSAAPSHIALPGVLHRALRAATRSDHVAVDRLILRLNLSSVADYGIFLQMHHAALQSLEADWRDEDRGDFSAMMRCTRDDLKALKISIAKAHSTSRPPLPASQRLGIAYVLRGSRLGAGVQRLRVPSSRPSSYLDFVPTLAWPRFLEQLDPAAESAARISSAEAIRGARLTFDLFASLFTQAVA
jgi:heme oxygenase